MTGDLYGDYSRLTFAPEKHFSSVLVQQGRVTLDADVNEHTAIVHHWLRRLTLDLIGPHGAPAGAGANFEVTLDASTPNRPVLGIAGGHMYVGGLLVEAEENTTYYEQPDAYLDSDRAEDQLPVGEPYMVYLKAWERHITTIEDPSIRERALGDNGPDTAARTKVVWQVHVTDRFPPGSQDPSVEGGLTVKNALEKWTEWAKTRDAEARPQLRATTRPPDEEDLTPCIAPPDARYRGLENQLYHVEIHTGGTVADATWKWSRDNGTAAFAVDSIEGATVTVASLGRDLDLGLDVGAWVELVDDRSILRGERHGLRQVVDIDHLDRLVTLDKAPDDGVGYNPALHPLLRRWDHQDRDVQAGFAPFDAEHGVLRVIEAAGKDGWVQLENGIQVQFQPRGTYLPGDFWVFPARTAISDIEWPQDGDGPMARPPVGINYSYAPLAVVDGATVVDLRKTFSPAKP